LTKLRRGSISITQMRPKGIRLAREASKAETFKCQKYSKGREEAQAQEEEQQLIIGLAEVENQDHPFVEGTWRRYRSHQGFGTRCTRDANEWWSTSKRECQNHESHQIMISCEEDKVKVPAIGSGTTRGRDLEATRDLVIGDLEVKTPPKS
jgi:hypothetical protein